MDIFFRITLPATVPFILTAVRLGLSAGLTTLLAAESTGAQAGLGMRIRTLQTTFELSSVDLPHPEGPTTQTNSFSIMSRLTPLRAIVVP